MYVGGSKGIFGYGIFLAILQLLSSSNKIQSNITTFQLKLSESLLSWLSALQWFLAILLQIEICNYNAHSSGVTH